VRTRRLDVALWLSLGIAAVATLPLYQLVAAGLPRAATFWTLARPTSIGEVYAFVLGTAGNSRFRAIWLILIVSIVAGRWWWRSTDVGSSRNLRGHEIVAGLACLAIPAAGLLIGETMTRGIFVGRYALLATAGIAIVVPVAVWRLGPRNGLAELVMFCLLALMFGRTSVQTIQPGRFEFQDPFLARPVLAQSLSGPGPVVVTGGVAYLPLWYYAPNDKRQRMVYLADPRAELEHTRSNTIDDGYLALQRHAHAGIEDLRGFVSTHRQFLLYDHAPSWLVPSLLALGAVMREEARESGAVLYRVELPPGK
jgi:hypothetical protein